MTDVTTNEGEQAEQIAAPAAPSVAKNPTLDASSLTPNQLTTLDSILVRKGYNPAEVTAADLEDKLGTSDLRQVLNRLIERDDRDRVERQSGSHVTQAQIKGARWRLTLPASEAKNMFAPTLNDLRVLAFAPRQIKDALEASMILDGWDAAAEAIGMPRPKRDPNAGNGSTDLANADASDGNDEEPF